MIFAVYLAQHIAPTQLKAPVHAIIVLGSGIQADQPAPTLKQRLDTSASIAKQQTDMRSHCKKIRLSTGLHDQC